MIESLYCTLPSVQQVVLVGKEPACQYRLDLRHAALIPGSGRSPEKGHGNPLQYSCLENSVDRGAWLQSIGSHRAGHN